MIRLSFIIPLYNCGQWIKRCLDSVCSVEMDADSYEVIVVDDGSRDDGPEQVIEYKESHRNVRLIHQQNSGASAARNRGLDVAQGEWIWFVDADDSIVPEILTGDVLNIMDDGATEMIEFNYRKDYGAHYETVNAIASRCVMDGCDNLRHGDLYLWNRLFRRTALRNVRFVEGTKNIEDFYFDICAILPMKRVVRLPAVGYSYNQQNMVSTSRNTSKENLKKLSDDTQTIYLHMLGDLRSLSGRQHDVVVNLLRESVAGYLFSLFRFYDRQDIVAGIDFLREHGLYPARKTANKKANVFLLLANHEKIFLAVHRLVNK